MICNPCSQAADFYKKFNPNNTGRDHMGHSACKGCTCQHKPVKEGQINRG